MDLVIKGLIIMMSRQESAKYRVASDCPKNERL